MHARSIVTGTLTALVVAGLAVPTGASAGAYSTLTIVSGDGQHVAVATAYAPLQVRTTDDTASPVSGVQVTYTVFVPGGSGTPASATFPGGATSAVVSSDASGLATAPTLTANNVAGSLEVDATTPDPAFQMKTFNLTNTATSTLAKVSGDAQQVSAGAAFAPLQVKATDGASPVSGVQVTYTIHPDAASGASATFPGSATSAVVSTDASGLATTPSLTANSIGGSFGVDATTPSPAQTLTFTLTNVAPDTTAPTVALSKPAANVSLSRSIALAWAGSDSGTGVASYDVRWRRAAWNGLYGGWNMLKSGTTLRSMTYTTPSLFTYGYNYCFSVRARDVAGNVSGWTTPPKCTAIPLDDRSLVTSAGWKRLTGALFFKGTMTQSATIGSTLTRTGVRGGRVALVATRAPGFGTVSVFYNGKFVKKVSLAWSTTQRRHVFVLPNFTASTGKIVIKVITAKRVQIDGLVAARL